LAARKQQQLLPRTCCAAGLVAAWLHPSPQVAASRHRCQACKETQRSSTQQNHKELGHASACAMRFKSEVPVKHPMQQALTSMNGGAASAVYMKSAVV
jgi:hypothetical protein